MPRFKSEIGTVITVRAAMGEEGEAGHRRRKRRNCGTTVGGI
jgi:hypothetical protein